MKMIGRIGLGLIVLAAASWSGWKLWSSTRRWVPATAPVSLTKGAHTDTGEFEINISGPYEIVIEGGGLQRYP